MTGCKFALIAGSTFWELHLLLQFGFASQLGYSLDFEQHLLGAIAISNTGGIERLIGASMAYCCIFLLVGINLVLGASIFLSFWLADHFAEASHFALLICCFPCVP